MRSMFRATTIALVLSVVAGVAQAQGGAARQDCLRQLAGADGGRAGSCGGGVAARARRAQGFKAALEKLQDSAQNDVDERIRRKSRSSLPAQKETKQKAIQAIEDRLQAKQQSFQQQFNARQAELMAPITDLVKKVIDDIRVEDGYAMILDNAPGASVDRLGGQEPRHHRSRRVAAQGHARPPRSRRRKLRPRRRVRRRLRLASRPREGRRRSDSGGVSAAEHRR